MPASPALRPGDGHGIFSLPVTPRGRQALRLFGAAVALCLFLIALTLVRFALPDSANQSDGSPPLWLTIPMLAAVLYAVISALSGGVLAALAVRLGERSFLILLSFAVALMALFFLVGDVLIGHE